MTSFGYLAVKVLSTIDSYSIVDMVTDLCRHLTIREEHAPKIHTLVSNKVSFSQMYHSFLNILHRRRKRGGARGGGPGPPIILEGGANIPFGPPNNPPAFSFNFYVKQEKITNVPS